MEKNGHEVYRLTRKYREVNQLLKLIGISAKIIGEHGGKILLDKLRASIKRTLDMTAYFESNEPDIAVSFSSPEMARVSYGLGIPHICINDSPHAEAVARLTVPLSALILTPKIIPKRSWVKYGISQEKVLHYNALDPWVWLKDFKPDSGILKQLGLESSKAILTFRPEESFAAYLLGIKRKESPGLSIIEHVLEFKEDMQIVAVPRYEQQIDVLKRVFKDKIVICSSTVDGPSLLYYTSIFVGGGGTMSAEAALLGVPTVSFYPAKPFIILDYMVRKNLLTLETIPKRASKRIISIFRNLENERKRQEERVQILTRDFEDPIDVIMEKVETYSRHSRFI